MTSSTPALTAVPDPDDNADEVAVLPPEQRGETPTEILGAPEDDVPLAVDPPTGTLTIAELTGIDLPEHRIIVPRWLKSRADAKAVALWCVRYVGNLVTFHVTRSPMYLVRVTKRTVVGTWRTVSTWWSWQWDLPTMRVWLHEMWLARQSKGDTDHSREARAHRKAWSETVTHRAIGAVLLLIPLVTAVVLAYFYAPPWVAALALVVALAILVRIGAPEDQPLIDGFYTSKVNDKFRLTSTMIVTALKALSIPNITAALKDDPKNGIRFPKPITIDGPGFRAEVDLPHGVTAAMVMEKRTELASGLRRPLGTVWPEPDPEVHAGRLVLWVGHTEMSKQTMPAPYEQDDWKGDIFAQQPFGFEQRKRPVDFSLMYNNMLIGALMDGGKTSSIRGFLCAIALDPTVEMRIAEHKGTGDLSMFEQFAHFYVSGVRDDHIEATVQQLRSLLKEADRRGEQITHLGKNSDLAPDFKVTRRTASMKHLGLHPIVMVIDEAQEVFGHDEFGKEAGKLAERLIKRGRAFGIMLIIATQRPDKDSLPTGITANCSVRFCLRVTDQITNDMILGTSAYKQGIQATTLSPRDKGVGYLRGVFDTAVVVRTYYLDKPAAEKVAKRALHYRKAAGNITGMAAGELPEAPESYSLLDDLDAIFVTSERMWSEDICARLAELRPDAYEGWTPRTLAAAIKPYDLKTEQLSINGANRKGLRAVQIRIAIEERRGLPELTSGSGDEGVDDDDL